MDITQLVLLSVRWHTFNKKMQENINELIDINLKLLSESQGGKLFHIDFVDENSKRLKDSQRFSVKFICRIDHFRSSEDLLRIFKL